jgi:hypothetical protein
VESDVIKKRELMSRAKDVPCMDCGRTFPTYVMEFDHREPRLGKPTIPAILYKLSISKFLGEIGKCDVVCANCHRVRTHNRRIGSTATTVEPPVFETG